MIFLFSINQSFASNKEKIIQNLSEIENLSFNFEQNINGKIEKGYCVLKYPKKIFCKYNSQYKKILVSDGKYLVIKTTEGRYVYPIDKTPLNLILNKNFLIDKIKILKSRIIDDKFINYKFLENDNEINLFFNKKKL